MTLKRLSPFNVVLRNILVDLKIYRREHLLRLNAETLELRRLKSDLTLTYRTVYGYCGLKFASFIHCLSRDSSV